MNLRIFFNSADRPKLRKRLFFSILEPSHENRSVARAFRNFGFIEYVSVFDHLRSTLNQRAGGIVEIIGSCRRHFILCADNRIDCETVCLKVCKVSAEYTVIVDNFCLTIVQNMNNRICITFDILFRCN